MWIVEDADVVAAEGCQWRRGPCGDACDDKEDALGDDSEGTPTRTRFPGTDTGLAADVAVLSDKLAEVRAQRDIAYSTVGRYTLAPPG